MKNGYYYIEVDDSLLIVNEPNCSWIWFNDAIRFVCIQTEFIKMLFDSDVKITFLGGI